ncbi:helix-turn-helix domain-containing protein [Streptomyces sp. NPDC002537]
MTSLLTEPPIAWRYCGNQMKLWRTEAGVSREQLAEEAGYVSETIKSMEQGRRKPTLHVLEIADEMCGARGKLKAAYVYLLPDKAPSRAHAFLNAEAEAVVLHSYQTLLIPGLLQTEEYARALMGNQCPILDEETIEKWVQARVQRQNMLAEKPTAMYTFVIYAAALRTGVGGPGAMKRQLRHLLELSELPNVFIHVLPEDRGAHGWLNGPMVILENVEHERYVYTESQEVSTLISDLDKISSFSMRYGMLQAQALNAEESAEFIRKLAEE